MDAKDFDGLCSICGARGRFARGPERSWREAYPCPACGFTQRWRDQAAILVDEFGRGEALSLHDLVKRGLLDGVDILEPALRGPFVRSMRGLPNYVQSYLWPDLSPGAVTAEGIRNEDLTRLTFEDESFDLVITSDVMEHLIDIRAAFAETLRVLRPGGIHVFSIPNDFPFPPQTLARVAMDGGEEVHLKPPVYHNAGDGSKCLVYTDFGADLTDLIHELGGRLSVVRRSSGILPCHTNATFVMRKIARAKPPAASLTPDARSRAAPVALVCPICEGTAFEDFNGRVNARCSTCRAVERNRTMWMILDRLGAFAPGQRVLHMAPELGLARRFKALSGDDYHPADVDPRRYASTFITVRALDLCTGLAAIPDESYDLIVHSHVLEHLPCDVPAVLRELQRILAPGGLHFLSVPVRGTRTAEDLSPTLTAAERRARFGQEDHYRIFGSESLEEMLRAVWGDHKHLVEPIEIFTRDELRRAAIPTVAWQGINSHSIFHARKGGEPPAVALASSRARAAETPPASAALPLAGMSACPDAATVPALAMLGRDNPWPRFPYGEHAPFHLALDADGDGGREIIVRMIRDHDVSIMVEVGCFLGGSAIRWLEAKDDLTVIGVDPWDGNWAAYVEGMATDAGMSAHVAHLSDAEVARIANMLREYGNFAVAMNNLYGFRRRFIPVRRFSPAALEYLSERDIPVDLVYLDASKGREDLDTAHRLFPDAILCGDDWLWPDASGEMTMQTHVKSFAREHGFEIEDRRQSWILHRRKA